MGVSRQAAATLLVAVLSALNTSQLAAATISNATLANAAVTTQLVPDPSELNQTAKVYITARYGDQWYARGAGLHDWVPFTNGQPPVAQEVVLQPLTPITVTDLNIAGLTGLTLFVGYATATTPLTAEGHQRAIFTVPPVSITANANPTGLQPVVANGEGASATFAATGSIDTNNAFFRPLGNGRSCASCHDQNAGWSITPDSLAARFAASQGLDPVFRLVDGANSPTAPVATLEQRFAAYSMLRTKGLIRVGLPIPTGAEFELAAVDDPYGYASAKELSLFRRPLPTTNLQFHNTVMWDGRETATTQGGPMCIKGTTQCFAPLNVGLAQQSHNATTGHAQFAPGLSSAEQQEIVNFEKSFFTSQIIDSNAGRLTLNNARGGPLELANTPFYFGINDVAAGDYVTGAPFTRQVMTLFTAWRNQTPTATVSPAQAQARAAIARGEQLFNNKPFTITNVRGFNDDLGQRRLQGTCASCHSTPNVGTHSVPRFMDTGVASAARRTPDMPLYTLRNLSTGEQVATTDPGRALITGKWDDIGKMKVPSLRGLESRSPYFHDGSENDVARLVRFYDRRFRIGLTENEVADLAAFLKAL